MTKKKKHKKDSGVNLPIIMDYGIGYMSVYNPTDMMPDSEPPALSKAALKSSARK